MLENDIEAIERKRDTLEFLYRKKKKILSDLEQVTQKIIDAEIELSKYEVE